MIVQLQRNDQPGTMHIIWTLSTIELVQRGEGELFATKPIDQDMSGTQDAPDARRKAVVDQIAMSARSPRPSSPLQIN